MIGMEMSYIRMSGVHVTTGYFLCIRPWQKNKLFLRQNCFKIRVGGGEALLFVLIN